MRPTLCLTRRSASVASRSSRSCPVSTPLAPEVAEFLSKGHVNFADEVTLATALAQVRNTPKPAKQEMALEGVDVAGIRRVIDGIKENGYIAPQKVRELLTCAGIPMVLRVRLRR